MAFEVKKINPLDRQPRKAVGISLPFSGQAVFNSTYTTKDAIKNNIINFFLTGKGERFFKMAPIHHHFELKGWPESRVVIRFWIIGILLALFSLTTFKIR